MEAALIGFLVSFAAPLAVGHLLLGRGWPRASRGPLTAILRASLALGLGLGLVSAWTCLWGFAAGMQRWSLAVGDAVLVGLALFAREGRMAAPAIDDERGGDRPWLVAAAGSAVVAAAIFVLISVAHPHGDGDAVAIWNLRARFLTEAWGEWDTVFFAPGLAHVDYPLLLPALVARGWTWAGERTPVVPAVLAGVFTFATAGLLLGGLAHLRRPAAGALAAAALLGTPFFVRHGAAQAADVPLAFYVTAALFLVLVLRGGAGSGVAALAGVAAGCAAWTKNEGILLGGLLLVALLARAWWGRRPEHLRSLAAGAALPVAVLVAFKVLFAPANDLIEAGDGGAMGRATDLGRWQEVLGAFGTRMVSLVPEGMVLGCSPAVLLLFGLVAGRGATRLPVRGPALLLATVLLCYVAVFVVASPYVLDWHLRTAAGRLILQLWPPALLLAFAWLRLPGERAHA